MKWEVEQRQREIEAQKQQVEMMEQCHRRELDNLQTALQASFDPIIQHRQNVKCYHVYNVQNHIYSVKWVVFGKKKTL